MSVGLNRTRYPVVGDEVDIAVLLLSKFDSMAWISVSFSPSSKMYRDPPRCLGKVGFRRGQFWERILALIGINLDLACRSAHATIRIADRFIGVSQNVDDPQVETVCADREPFVFIDDLDELDDIS